LTARARAGRLAVIVNALLGLPLAAFAPATVLAALIGMANGALFFLACGRSAMRLPLYLVGAATVAALVQPIGLLLAPSGGPAVIGEVSLAVVSLGVWAALSVARLLGL